MRVSLKRAEADAITDAIELVLAGEIDETVFLCADADDARDLLKASVDKLYRATGRWGA